MYLGIDLGTSGVKTVLLDDQQRVIASETAALGVDRPQDGWSEQNPSDWIAAIETTFDALLAAHGKVFGGVRGIGLSGHMHGATLLDRDDEVLRPCMLWNDTRSAEQARRLDTEQSRQLTGNILFAGFTAPKVDWVRENEPACFARIARVLLPKDYVRLWLTGEHVSDPSDASGTGWLDVARRDWSDELLAACELDRESMPRLVEGTAVSGRLRRTHARRWTLSEDVVVAGSAGDNAASACGMGTLAPGSAFLSLGTSGVLFASNAEFRPNAESAVHAFCHAVPDTWHQMGVILAATDALNWLASITGQSPARLTESVREPVDSPSKVVFLPYLGGERTPINDADARGAFMGLSHASDVPTLTRAVLEGVAYAFRDCQQALDTAGTALERATAIGGGSRSEVWLRLLANVLQLPLDRPADGDYGASLGAARLAMIAAESADPAEVCKPPPTDSTIEPTVSADRFEAGHARYRASYEALRDRRDP